VSDELTAGPQGLWRNSLRLQADLAERPLTATFTYGALSTDASALHHAFSLELATGPCEPFTSCGRLSLFGGFSPSSANTFGVERQLAGQLRPVSDRLAWSSLAAGLGFTGQRQGGLGYLFSLRLQSATIDFRGDTGGAFPARALGTTEQLKVRGGGLFQRGPLELRLTIAGNAYFGDGPGRLDRAASPSGGAALLVPLRGVFLEEDAAGFAPGPQALELEARGSYLLPSGLRMLVSYGYLSYAGNAWSSTHLLGARVQESVGRVALGLGLTLQLDAPQVLPPGAAASDYAALYCTGSASTSF
jgi:hypothetical protein